MRSATASTAARRRRSSSLRSSAICDDRATRGEPRRADARVCLIHQSLDARHQPGRNLAGAGCESVAEFVVQRPGIVNGGGFAEQAVHVAERAVDHLLA